MAHLFLWDFQSIVTEDPDDIVQNSDQQEWQKILVAIVCMLTKQGKFANLAE